MILFSTLAPMRISTTIIKLTSLAILIQLNQVKLSAQNSISKELIQLHQTIKNQHIKPNNSFTAERAEFVISECINQIDPNGFLFLQSEVDQLYALRAEVASIDNNAPFMFYDAFTKSVGNGLKRTDSIITKLSEHKWSFESMDMLTTQDTNFAEDFNELLLRWKNTIKTQYAYHQFFQLDSAKWETALQTDQLQDSIFQNIITENACYYNYLIENEDLLNQGLKNILFNAYAMSYDPHSSYFSAQKKDNFTQHLSSENYQFGFELEKNSMGQFEISYLQPGSPAWNSNKLNIGDVILSLKLNGKDISFSCREGDEIVAKLTGNNSEKLAIRVKKQSGIIERFTLYSEVVENVENNIHSYLLKGDLNIGYIGLPAFYTTWDNGPNKGCANDVGKELLKLKNEKIDGLILDLRDNGGGALNEALALSGAFVSEGSLCIVNEKGDKPRLYKDPNRGKLYTGSLIVLINEYSASASEVTAGILQDFNRAIIVGSASFGKASGQNIIPLSYYRNEYTGQFVEKSDNTGYIKLTTLELYNLKGHSHQGNGVQPDITIPSKYDAFKFKESDYDYSLTIEPIEKKTYYTPEPELPLAALKEKSSTRLKNDSTFNEVLNNFKTLYGNPNDVDTIYLDAKRLKEYIENGANSDVEKEKYEYKQSVFTAKVPSYDARIYSLNPTKKEMSDDVIHELETDGEIVECYRILNDLHKLNLESK